MVLLKLLYFMRLSSIIRLLFLIFIIKKINSQIIYDNEKYTEFHTGNVNILLSVPHDGQLKPASITDRTEDASNNLKGDFNTRKLGLLIRAELARLLGSQNKIPFIIFNNLHRIKMDPNRNEDECCVSKNETSFKTYNNYHNFIVDKFEKGFLDKNPNYKQGLLIDIHGQSHPENWIELGYLLTASQLNTIKNLTDYKSTSLNSLSSVSEYTFERIIRGDVSLGGILELKYNLKVVPSPSYLSPNGGNYYNGGYITKVYSSMDRKINTIQIESPYSLRIDAEIDYYATCLARSIYDFYILHNLDE